MKWFSEHPWWTAGIILTGGLLLFWYWKSPGSSQAVQVSGGQNAAMQMAQLQASTQLGLAKLAADVTSKQTDAALTAKNNELAAALQAAVLQSQNQTRQINAQTDLGHAQIDAAIQNAAMGHQADMALAGNQSATAIGLARIQSDTYHDMIAGQVTMAQINAGVQSSQIASQQAVLKAQIEAAQAMAMDANRTNLAMQANSILGVTNIASIQMGGQVAINASNNFTQSQMNASNNATEAFIANQQAEVFKAQAKAIADANIAMAETQATIATQNGLVEQARIAADLNIAGLWTAAQVTIAQTNAGAAIITSNNNRDVAIAQTNNNYSIAQANADAAEAISRNNMWGSIFGGVTAGLLGFV